jgi:D-aminoacyl-tRNA deacylase
LVDGNEIGKVATGYVVLVGVGEDDTDDDASYLADKVFTLRVLEDDSGKMNKSIADTGGGVLAVSQFTLFGDVRGQRRPSFIKAAPPEVGRQLFDTFVTKLRARGVQVETGEFGAHMIVDIVNDRPVTIIIDSKKTF